MVAKAPPDGHTLLLATVSTLCITPALYAKPLIHHTDFAPVAMMGRVVLFLVCRPDLPVRRSAGSWWRCCRPSPTATPTARPASARRITCWSS